MKKIQSPSWCLTCTGSQEVMAAVSEYQYSAWRVNTPVSSLIFGINVGWLQWSADTALLLNHNLDALRSQSTSVPCSSPTWSRGKKNLRLSSQSRFGAMRCDRTETYSYMYSFWKFMSAYVFKPSLLLWQSSKICFFFFQGILLRIFQLDIWYWTEKSIWRTLAVSQRSRPKKHLSELTVSQLLGKHFTRQKSSTLTKRTKRSSHSECRWKKPSTSG